MRLTPEIELLKDASAFSQHYQSKLPQSKAIDWNKFIELATHHRVLPAVFCYLKDQKIQMDTGSKLRDRNHQTVLQNMYQVTLLVEIDQLFKKENIKCIHFKGPSLSQFLYNQPDCRQSKDIDILIERENLNQAVKTLKLNGFQCKHGEFKKNYLNKRYQKWYKDYTFVKNGFSVELHYLINDAYQEETCNQLFHHIEEIKINEQNINILNSEDYLTYLIIHGYSSGFSRLHWLVDIKDFLSIKKVDHQAVKDKILQIIGKDLFSEVKQLIKIIFNGSREKCSKLNTISIKMLFKRSQSKNEYSTSIHHQIHTRIMAFYLTKSLKKKIMLFNRKTMTSYADWQIVELPKSLFFTYYIGRPLLITLRKMFANKT